MHIAKTIADSVKTQETLNELKEFVDNYLAIESETKERTLKISVEQSEVRLSRDTAEISIGAFEKRTKVTLDNRGHIVFSDSFGNTITLFELMNYVRQIEATLDNDEDEINGPSNPPGGGGTGNLITSVFGRTGAIQANANDYANFYTTPTDAQTIARTALGNSGPIQYNTVTGIIGIQFANNFQPGALLSSDWNTFNNKQSTHSRLSSIVSEANPTSAKLFQLNADGTITFVDSNYNPNNVSITGGNINATIGNITRNSANFSLVTVFNSNSTQIPLLIQTVSGQSADNIRVNDSSGNPAFRITASGTINLKSGTTLRMGNDLNPANNPILLQSPRTGWNAPTGTQLRGTFNADTATLAQTAQTLAALLTDLRNHHGIITT